MGMMILIVAVIVEAAIAVFCIISKSYRIKEKSIIRIASFVSFILLAVLHAIDWSLRYYALASFLLLLAIFGVKTLFQKKEAIKEFKTVRVVLRAIGMTILIFTATIPALIFPQNRAVVATTGEYQVLTQTYTYTDINRVESYTDTGENRKLNVQFWYPDTLEESVPLIVYSHGGLGVKLSNESLYNELASHGYVVCSIDHTYQSFFSTDENGDTKWINIGYMQELLTEDARSNIRHSYELYQKWMKVRIDDINFVIDYIIAEIKSNNLDTAYNLVDITKVGIMGHSLGGSAALGIGRIRADVDAVIALESPCLFDIEGIENDRFVLTDKPYPVPVLNVYSDSSWSIIGERPQYAANYRMLFDTDVNTFYVYISGVGHLALTDLALVSPFLTRLLDGKKPTPDSVYWLKMINKICLEFFDSYLKRVGDLNREALLDHNLID